MEQTKKPFNWVVCSVIVLVLGCIGTVAALGGLAAIGAWVGDTDTDYAAGTTSKPLDKDIPFEAVVQITTLFYEDDELVIGWGGSGSLISPDGLILTNAHVVLPDRYFPVDKLLVSLTIQEDHPPQAMYYAEVLQADATLDVAVIRITTDLDDNPVDRPSLDLPYVALGDPGDLTLGDQITILGYPDIGGKTITLTRGEVSGFTAESGRGDRAFIKTSATIAGGNSGGLASDDTGSLIGIPTQLGYGGDDQYIDCRVLADTNRDGVVDDNDNCVPTGGFINALRPVDLALPLIEAARRGETNVVADVEQPPEEVELPQPGEVLFSDDFSDPDPDWDPWKDQEGEVKFEDEQLHIQVLKTDYIIWSTPDVNFSDVVINVDASIVRPTGDGDFGVICRYHDLDNFYSLTISEDGYFAIWKTEDGEYDILVDWTHSRTLPLDDRSRTITVACVGDSLTLAVDGEPLAEAHDGSFSSGDVGLIAGTWDNAGIEIAFDNFIISYPEE